MRIHHRPILTALVALAVSTASGNAAAQWRCDCTNIVGSCQATADVRESFIEVTSNVEQCARVDYLVDGIPFVAMVVDGTDRQDWIAQSASPAVIVQSCQVCRDNAGTTAQGDSGSGSGLTADGEPMLLISVDPVYPADAATAGLEGWVDVRFSISELGRVSAPEVVAAEPTGIFEQAALAAVSRWRYTQPAAGEEPELTERVEFDLSDALLSLSERRPQARQVVAYSSPPRRNDCVREESRFDFGGTVDVSLINACSEPLLVYSCTTGTGSDRERWICRDPEQTTTLLQPRAGAGATVAGLDNVQRLELTRAANSEYWWLACAVADSVCRESGREWIRSLNRQTASIDPQARTRTPLARSF